jgi:glycosyltransferase involved in cell wall biosynthesis
MNEPLVSIVIPVYNGSNYLSQAIESALAQSYLNLEVIVVNDGSDDGGKTKKVAEAYSGRIRYIEKENGGVASALNCGIEFMSGEYFSWLSHDDLYYPEKIQTQVNFSTSRGMKKKILYSHEDMIDANGAIIRKSTGFSHSGLPLPYVLLYNHFIGGCSLLIPRSAFEDAGLFDLKYRTVQDYDLWFRMMAMGYEFIYCPFTSGMSRQHALQDSRSKQELHWAEKDELFLKVQKELPAKYWLEPLPDKVVGVFFLAEEFRKQGLVKAAEYDRDLLKHGLICTSRLHRVVNIARYYALIVSAFVRRRFKQVKKAFKKTLLSLGLLKR